MELTAVVGVVGTARVVDRLGEAFRALENDGRRAVDGCVADEDQAAPVTRTPRAGRLRRREDDRRLRRAHGTDLRAAQHEER